MSSYLFTEEELAATIAKYPRLRQKSDGLLIGKIDLNHQYENNVPIIDVFQVSIKVDNEYPESFPQLTETGGRTKAVAMKYDITDYRDLHCYAIHEPGAACVCAPQENRRKFPKGNDLVVYIDNLVVPYLYGLSYYEKFEKWPWGERSHGALGVLEAYADLDNPTQSDIEETLVYIRIDPERITYHKQLKKLSPNKKCSCESGKSFHRCHKKALVGLERLSNDAKELGLNVKQILDIIANQLKNK